MLVNGNATQVNEFMKGTKNEYSRCSFPWSRLVRWQQKKVKKYNKAFFSRKSSNTKHKLKKFELGIKHKDPDSNSVCNDYGNKECPCGRARKIKMHAIQWLLLKDLVTLCS